MGNRQVEDRQEGALRRAPFVLGAILLVTVLSLLAMIRGWWLDQHISAPVPSTEQSSTSAKTSMKEDPPFAIDVVLDLNEDQVAQKQAGNVAGLVFSLIHQPFKSNEERFRKLSELITEPVYSVLQAKSDLPLEPVSWKRIKVVSVRPLASDHWSFLVGGVIREDEVESAVQIQVRKVAGVWKVVSIDE